MEEERKRKKRKERKGGAWASVLFLGGLVVILVGFGEWSFVLFLLGFGWARRSEPMPLFWLGLSDRRRAGIVFSLGLSAGLR